MEDWEMTSSNSREFNLIRTSIKRTSNKLDFLKLKFSIIQLKNFHIVLRLNHPKKEHLIII